MAQNGRPTLTKRQLEAKRHARRRMKEEKRAARKEERRQNQDSTPQSSGVDPDIADIIPGPQPPRF